MNEIDDLIKLSNNVTESNQAAKIEDLKAVLLPVVEEMVKLNEEKSTIELQLKEANKRIAEQELKIRTIWGPHIIGTEKASMDFGEFKLTSEQKQNVSVSDEENARESAIDWLINNEYKDVLKWDINTNTLKAIAAKELKEHDVKIPGLKYSTFNKVGVK